MISSADSARPAPFPRPPARGAALLVVIVSIAILTAIALDLAYSTRVSLLAAANARDELRAEYQARGAVQFSRLVLKFQKQLDAMPQFRFQLWSMVPITSDFTAGLFADSATEGEPPAGRFDAKLEDEARKVNAQMDGIDTSAGAQVVAFLQLVGDPKWDPLFDREDANGQRVSRTDLVIYLHDWTDDGSVTSSLSPATAARPFEDAFGDENQPYARGDDPYKVKNARFDSLDELYLVAGIDDAFMAAFGNQLTVYLDKNSSMNINTNDLDQLLIRARMLAPNVPPARWADQKLQEQLMRAIQIRTQSGLLALTVKDFTDLVLGLVGDSSVGTGSTSTPAGTFADSSSVYRIRATGTAGGVERRADAVVYIQDASSTGKLLHWREE